MEKMTDEEIARELSSMSADQVRNIQKQYGKMFPEDKHFLTMCTIAIAEKEEEKNRSEFVKLLLEEKKNAPDSELLIAKSRMCRWNTKTAKVKGWI